MAFPWNFFPSAPLSILSFQLFLKVKVSNRFIYLFWTTDFILKMKLPRSYYMRRSMGWVKIVQGVFKGYVVFFCSCPSPLEVFLPLSNNWRQFFIKCLNIWVPSCVDHYCKWFPDNVSHAFLEHIHLNELRARWHTETILSWLLDYFYL